MRLVAVVLVCTPAGEAFADADPASDVLIYQSVYYPYSPAISKPLSAQLNTLVASAKRSGFPIKIALIGTRADLGGVPHFYGKPMEYADFLGQEISFNKRQPLLIVARAGYGIHGVPAAASGALRGLDRPAGPGDDLARAAIIALPKVAAASGKHVRAVKPVAGSKPGSSGSGTPAAVIFGPVVLLALAGAAVGIISRRRRVRDEDDRASGREAERPRNG